MSITQTIVKFLQVVAATLLILANASLAEAAPFAYIVNQNSNNVSVIDTATNTVVATVAVFTSPNGVAINPAGTRAYVTNNAVNNVSVIDTATNFVVATVAVGTNPISVAFNPGGTRAYVANVLSSNVSVIDTATNTVVATVAVGTNPYDVAVNPAGTRAYVANQNSNSVSVLDTATNTVVATVAVGLGPSGVAVNPVGTRAYVVNSNSNNVSVIDTATDTVVATVAAGTFPYDVAVNPAGTRAYMANQASNDVSVIDTATNTVVATVSVGTSPVAIAVNPTLMAIVPGAPIIGSATAGNGSATVTYTPPAFDGGSSIFTYTATSNPGGITGSTTGGPVIVSGLTNGTAYTFAVTATNTVGTSPPSAASNIVTPFGPTLAIAYSPTVITVGGSSTLTYTITNAAGQPSQTGLGFQNAFTLGPGLTSASAISGAGCAGAPGLGPAIVNFSGGTMPAGPSTCTFTVTVQGVAANAYTNNNMLFCCRTAGIDTAAAAATLTVLAPPPVITSPPTAGGVTGAAFTYSITATNSPTSFGASGLPAGLAVNISTGVISGTPSVTGTFGATITAANGGGTGSQTFTITVTAPPNITSTAPAVGTVGVAYSHIFTATGTTPMTWSIVTGTVPAGLTLNATSGLLSGTPTAASSFFFTVQVANGTAPNAAQSVTIVVNPLAPVINSPTTASGVAGSSLTYSITATNSPTSFGASGLPAGLSVNTSSGVISGFPSVTGTFAATITATNGGGKGSQTLLITITAATVAPTILSILPGSGSVGIVYTHTFIATGTTPMTWSIVTGTVPAGLTLNATSGVLSGTPTTANLFAFTIQAANGTAPNANMNFNILINPPVPVITSPLTASGVAGSAFTYSITATNSPTSFGATGLPAGLSVNISTGVISGIPSVTGTFAATITATNGSGSGTQALSITITAASVAPTITSTAPPMGTVGLAYSHTFTSTGTTPIAWTIASGALPAGLSLGPTTGVLSGTPTAAGTFSFVVQAANGTAFIATQNATVSIAAATVPPTITSALPANGTVGVGYTHGFMATGATLFTWTLAAGSFPPGVTLNASTGVLSGTPTAAGAFGFTVQVANGTAPNATQSGNITIAATALPPTLSLSLSSPTTTPGIAVGLVFNISNPGAAALNAGAFIFTYPAGIVTATVPTITNTCGGSVTSVNGSTSLISASGLAISPMGSCAIGVNVSSAITGGYTFTFPAGGFSASTGSNAVGSSAILTVTAVALPAVTLAPSTVNFGSRTVNTTSPATVVTLTNSGTANLTISSITSSGDFGFTSTCPIATPPITAGGNCAINITFTPLTVAVLNGSISMVSNAPGSPHTITLSGTGSASAVSGIAIAPAALTFGAQTLNTTSATQSITITNTGFANLSLSSIAVATPFSRTTVGPTATPPDCASSLAPGSSCQIGVTFTATNIGTLSGFVSITDNAAGSPHTVALTGTGTPIPVPVIGLSSPVSFGDQIVNSASSSRTVTISNTGTATLTISAITLTGTNATNFTLSGQSGCTSIAASGNCNLTVSFTPTTTGAKTAQINLTSNAQNAATVNSISLTGNGILAPRAIANFSATAVGYGNVIFGGATPNQIITLTNIGGQAMNVTSIAVTGDFIQTNNCGSSLAPLATCTINIIFTPLGQGVRFGEFILNSSSDTSPDRIQLSGTGCRWFSQAQSRFFLTSCG